MNEIFNFSAGPSMLPKEVMYRIRKELRDWNNLKVSVMEVSHRSNEFYEVVDQSERDIRSLLNIPENYKVLFCHGGGRMQFSAVPMNLLRNFSYNPDYINSGYWSYHAAQEAKKYCQPKLINVTLVDSDGVRSVENINLWKVSDNNSYLHYCPNETIDGITIREVPNFSKDMIVIGDFSSILLSEPLDVHSFSIIYAAAQKNIGIPGLTIVIIREDLLEDRAIFQIPTTLQYSVLAKNRSMFNTPPTFSWYIAGLIFQWIRQQGGLLEMSIRNKKKADLLYKTIDESDFYYNNVALPNRSYMNVSFFLHNQQLNEIFINESKKIGLYSLKGHKAIGGMRASLYNAMPLQGVKVLREFMMWFSRRYG